jgi:hypothetical protein
LKTDFAMNVTETAQLGLNKLLGLQSLYKLNNQTRYQLTDRQHSSAICPALHDPVAEAEFMW